MRNLGNGILRLVGLALIVMPLAALANTSLTGVEYVRTANGDVKLYLKTSGDAPDVTVFATESPARIVLDMADTESSVGADKVHVGQGVVQQYSAVTAGGRTRLVVDLSSPAAYDYSSENSQVVLTVAAGASGSSAAPASSGYGPAVTNVDFRLGEDGQARVIISTDKPGASLSVRENPGSLTVD
ncbi:MAG: AMIN domain-containing protein, partial [Xanthomonadales bacterium]|nr:AMIN domain-containing protein [Xanthomonadales bacterium]